MTWLVLDGWTGTGANSLVSSIILYDHESGFLKTYTPPGVADLYRATLRYDLHLLSTDLDGDGDIDIPTEITDGGELGNRYTYSLRFLLWRDYATAAGGNNIFGVYDSEYRFFLRLPDALHGNVQLRGNFEATAGSCATWPGPKPTASCALSTWPRKRRKPTRQTASPPTAVWPTSAAASCRRASSMRRTACASKTS